MVNAQNNKAQKSYKENQQIANRELDQREKEFDFQKKMYNDQQKAAKEEKRESKAAAKEENRESKKQEKDNLEITFNKYNVNVDSALSKKVDDRLTANENEMFEKISSGNFNWDDYDIRKHTPS